MNHGLNIDFCFLSSGSHLVVAGWTPTAGGSVTMHAESGPLQPVHALRFPRRDLRSIEPLGFIAIFDLTQEAESLDGYSQDVFLSMGQEHVRVSGSRLITDARKIVEIGVDETFFSLLRLMAGGHLPLPAGALAKLIIARILAAPQLPAEADSHALAVEKAVIAPGGQGVAAGWFLPTGATAGSLAALAFDDLAICRVVILQGCVARADLAPYGNRFLFSGSDGWLAAFRFASERHGRLRLLTMLPGRLTECGVVSTVVEGPATKVARLLLEARAALTDATLADALHRQTLAPPDDTDPPAPSAAEAAADAPLASDAPILLVLDHDLPAHDLRDVLRRLSRETERPILLHLLRAELTPELREAVLGAAREIAQPLTIAGWGLQVPMSAQGPALLVFARSSILFHISGRLPPLELEQGHELHVRTLDVLADLPGGAAGLAARFLSDRPPFLCWGNAARLLPRLSVIAADDLVPESAFRRLADMLNRQARLCVSAATARAFHAGTDGPFPAPLIDAITPHDFDDFSARLGSKEFS